MELLNPRIDFVFSKLFGAEENKDILISLINSIVEEKDQVQDVILQNPYNIQNFQGDKLSIMDIKAKDKNSVWFNIEMQVAAQAYYDKRTLYYWARLYSSQVTEGAEYTDLKKTIVINLLYFSIFEEEDYHSTYRILNAKTHKPYLDHLEIHFIELKKGQHPLAPYTSILERWIHFLTKVYAYEKNKVPQELLEIEPIQKAVDVLHHISLNPEERKLYDRKLQALRDETGMLKEAEIKGIEIGKEQGIEIGKEQGIEIGEKRSKQKIAQALLEQKADLAMISAVTGLSTEEIFQLQQERSS